MQSHIYEPVIGLEVHIQLLTQSKAFCGDDISFGAGANSQTSTISLAHPGTLPRANKKQVELAIRLGIALGCEITSTTYFDRKHYFYADLPKGFQTTQDSRPICMGGTIEVGEGTSRREIRIHHIHMEEDAGKSIHDQSSEGSLIDYNRAGVPLLELVTEPDLRSSEEVYQFINKLRQLVRYLDVSDGNMEEGSLRADCNVSIRPKGSSELNTRCEIKNINSARFAARAVDFEIRRQSEILEKGGTIIQETREYSPGDDRTVPLRGKEEAHDYRYFPEPDLPPLSISNEMLRKVESSLPVLPAQWHNKFISEFGLSIYDADLLVEHREIAQSFDTLLQKSPDIQPSLLSKLYINKIIPHCNESGISIGEFEVPGQHIVSFLELIETDKISTSVAYQKLWPALLETKEHPQLLAQKLNLIQSFDEDYIAESVKLVLIENPAKVEAYKKGKKALLSFFIGQVMRKTNGKANPQITRKILQSELNSSTD